MMSTQKTAHKFFASLLGVLLIFSLLAMPLAGAEGTATPTPTPAPVGGSPYVTAYTVQNSDGTEIQKLAAGQKCQIVIGICDPRYSAVPTAVDGNGNIANAKITSTASFASPSLGDIRCTTPKMSESGLRYSIVFNDISYIGGSSTLSFDLSYAAQDTALTSMSQAISQCTSASGTTSTIQPTVMVQSSSYGKDFVSAGETFTLDLTSYNTSSTAAISNVVTTLTLPDKLTLAGGSNSVMTSGVAAGGSFANQFTLMAQPGAETGIANITVTYTYYTASSEAQLTSSQIITVSIRQPDRFSFSSMDIPSEMYTGEENTVSVGFVNKGKGILYNVQAEISGNLSNPGQAQYLGNLQPGAEGSVDFNLTSDTAGTVSGTVTITYEDLAGNQTTQTKEYSVTILEMTPVDTGMPVDPGVTPDVTTQSGMPWWGWLLIAVAVVVAIVVTVNQLKKRKARKLRELEEEDEDN